VFADLSLAPGPYLVLRVSDTGCGMDRVTLGKIFDPYFTTRGEQGGTGLGLSVVHGIISHHNGHISVYSEPGHGTTFRLYLPQLQSSHEGKDPGQIAGVLQRGQERLLIVDDESVLLEVMQRILEDLGYSVTAAGTPLAALQYFTADPEAYDLLITDMNMPEMNGAELIGKIRAIRQDIPVVLCTGFSELMNGNSTRALGAARHVMKPVTQRELNETIRNLLDGRAQAAS
jgi:CheY-like chemotaxis protein